ncbi:tRNA (adenosine(37)-N6)-threonylcarbamoyltransferase complex ATPase subunit type 1 TsaE [Amphritea balenae]|uniref:tRNA threonylcarbamoyladenosine biosynthesis protein TsaE n=1 Tax=Amphritea balenae TaxID=452629 RepID=A0A3P1SUC3_9GAMM|nr:tRNA (adenosine(37)-N6)-threonylcarbamoyltransferase complex ATPase subunit type 1 TsaE [Amphritea balenae]RRC99752.1 tRNA (adenosine(37)-N6)-threonylcarbamoyltransferase complex ATPase subunit type 1 TsaE [Amphritea balenae]GGK79545.1 tRNA threonylcarbamoyladenosine biosynthesis protein TsaE [Amphritea balenae]
MPQQIENSVFVPDESGMVQLGKLIARSTAGGEVIFLNGDLGMGKTTLSRGVLQGFGHQGSVKSPTYTLVEPYEFDERSVFHFDLYRLGDPEELEYLGIRDYFTDEGICLIEWPERGEGVLPVADLQLNISVEQRGRRITWQPQTEKGRCLADKLNGCLTATGEDPFTE